MKAIAFSLILRMVNRISLNQDVEEEEVDYILNSLHRFGDSELLWPTSEYVLKNEICLTSNKNLSKVINFVLSKFENNYDIQVIYRLYVNELTRILNAFCFNKEGRDKMLKAFNEINNKVIDIKTYREKVLLALNQAMDPMKPVSIENLICYMKKFATNTANTLTTSAAKSWIRRYQESLVKALDGFIRTIVKSETNSCDLPELGSNFSPKFKSIYLTLMYALNNSLSNRPILTGPQTGLDRTFGGSDQQNANYKTETISGTTSAPETSETTSVSETTGSSENHFFEHPEAKVSFESEIKSNKEVVNEFRNPKIPKN